MILPKQSELKPLVDFYLLKMHQNGQIRRIANTHLAKPNVESCQQTLKEIRYQNTVSAFMLLGCGIIFALIYLGVERYRAKFK